MLERRVLEEAHDGLARDVLSQASSIGQQQIAEEHHEEETARDAKTKVKVGR